MIKKKKLQKWRKQQHSKRSSKTQNVPVEIKRVVIVVLLEKSVGEGVMKLM